MAVDESARIEPYGFENDFEEQVIFLLCDDEDFYRRLGFLLEPEAFKSPIAQELARTVHLMVDEGIRGKRKRASDKPPSIFERRKAKYGVTPLYAVQKLNQLSREGGRIPNATVVAAMDYVERITDKYDLDIDDETVIGLLVPELKRRVQGKAINTAIGAYQDRKEFKDVIALLEEAEVLGDPTMAIGAGTLNLESNDTYEAIEALQGRSRMPTGIEDFDRDLGGGIPESSLFCIMGAPGAGKCWGKDTELLSYSGAKIKVQELKAGDLLMGPDSQPRRVQGTTRGTGPLFRIEPIEGDAWVCNDAHMLTLVNTYTGAVVDVSVAAYLASGSQFKHDHKLFRVGVEFAPTGEELPISPYFLGLFIGQNSICLEERSSEFLRGFDIESGRIAHRYLTGSRKDRLELLAGLLDTDGYLSHRGFEFVQKKRFTSEDVCFLVRSLGLRAVMSAKEVPGYGVYWRVNISGDCSIIPTRIHSKQAQKREQRRDVLRTGFSVFPLGEGEYFGCEVDQDHRLLLADFTVNHNSIFLNHCAVESILANEFTLYATLEVEPEIIMARLLANITGIAIDDLHGERLLRARRLIGEISGQMGAFEVEMFEADVTRVQNIKDWVHKKEDEYGLKCKQIIIDYADYLSAGDNTMHTYQSMKFIYRSMYSWAHKEKTRIYTASATKEKKDKKGTTGLDDASDSRYKARIVDIMAAVDRPPEGVVLSLPKNRVGKSQGIVGPFPADFSCGRLVYHSRGNLHEYMERQRAKVAMLRGDAPPRVATPFIAPPGAPLDARGIPVVPEDALQDW